MITSDFSPESALFPSIIHNSPLPFNSMPLHTTGQQKTRLFIPVVKKLYKIYVFTLANE